MEDCIFCKIVRGEIPCSKVYEDGKVMAFDDINPMAPIHVIVVPKEHIATLMDMTPDNIGIMSDIYLAAEEVARVKGIDERGFRTVINCNEEGGQIVFHVHLHLLGGRRLKDDLA